MSDELDQIVLDLILKNPQISHKEIREVSQSGRHAVEMSIKRHVQSGRITDREYTDLEDPRICQKVVPYGVCFIQTPPMKSTRSFVEDLLDKFSSIGLWKFIADSGEHQHDYIFFLTVDSGHPELKSFYAEIREYDEVTTKTHWCVV